MKYLPINFFLVSYNLQHKLWFERKKRNSIVRSGSGSGSGSQMKPS